MVWLAIVLQALAALCFAVYAFRGNPPAPSPLLLGLGLLLLTLSWLIPSLVGVLART